MLLVSLVSHKLKMAAASTLGREYNRRAAIIEGFRAERSPTKIIRFFEYPRSTVYNVVAKYSASEQSNESSSTPARKSHSKEPRKHREDPYSGRKDPSADFGRSRTIVAKISINYGCKPTMHRIVKKDLQQNGASAHTSHLVQNWLSDNIDTF